jgi:hypothetical protein
MREVAAFKALQTLDLTYTNVTDAGLKDLEGLKGLRELHCVGAAVTEAGVERLRKALPEAKITAGEGAGARPTLDPSAASEPALPPAAGDTDAAAGRPQGRLAEIRGRVLDPAGKPVPGAKVFVAGRGHVVFDAKVKPPLPTTETDAEGRFRLSAPAEGAKGIAVSTPALRAWSVALNGPGEEIVMRLPEPGRLVLRYRMEGDDPEAVFCVELKTWEMPAWKDVAVLRLKANAPNKGEVVLANLPPGTYDLWREKSVFAGDAGLNVFCDRRYATVTAGNTTVVEFVRGKGFSITGRTVGLPEGAVPGVFVTVKAAGAEANQVDYMVPRRDAVVCPPNGQFTTAPVPPGQYILEASAFKPEPRTGVEHGGLRGPDFVGSAPVTVPEDGPPESVRIEMQGAGRASAAPPAPADEVLKQLITIVELEERILAAVQERFNTGHASAEDVGRQQLKVTDAKVRLAERKAELASPPSAAPTDEIRRQLAAAVTQEAALLAQVQERYRVGKATGEEVDRQQVRLAEAKLRLARLPAVPAAAPGTPSDTSVPAAPPHPAATPILKIRATDGAAVADVHDGAVRVRLGDKTVEGPTIIVSLDSGAAGAPRKSIVLDVRDGAVRMSAAGAEVAAAEITIHPDGRMELRSGKGTEVSEGPGSAAAAVVQVFELRHAQAGAVADALRRTYPEDTTRIVSDPGANRIVAIAPPGRLAQIAELVRQLDQAVGDGTSNRKPPGSLPEERKEPSEADPQKTPPIAGDARARTGQRIFPLKYQEADASEAVVSGNTFQHCLPGRPAEAKAVPADLSGQARYFLLPIGGRKVLTVLDTSPSPRLFVDVAGTGDLAAAQPLPAKPWGPLHQFGPVAIPVDGQAGRVARVRFLSSLEKNDKDIAVAPAGYVAGEVNLDGQAYRVALVDHSLSGRYDNVRRGDGTPESARGETYLAIDLNQDGRLEPPGASASETFDLLPTLHVGNAYYRVQVAPDGSSIALTDAKPDFSTLDTGCADLSLTLVGEYGFRRLSGSGGKWQVPAGWHAATDATLNRTDAAGTLWSLHGVSSWGRLTRFDTRAGQVLSLRAGPPLSVKVHPSGLQPNGMIHFALALVGQAGENYNAAPKRGGVPQPPRFRVFDEAGRAIGSGVFNPGTAGTYSWCWWRVPEGFKGKYRVAVEGDFGPFEIARSEPEWFSLR